MELKCIYCGENADSREHAIPQCFFPRPFPQNLITVPACIKCNNSYSSDEDYARIVLSSARTGENMPLAEQIWEQKVARSLIRNQKITHEIYNSMIEISDSLIAFKVDRSRIDKVITKIVQGMFFEHYKEPIGRQCIIKVHMWPGQKNIPSEYPQEIIEGMHYAPIHVVGNGVLRYKWISSEESIHSSLWALSFYNNDYNNFFVWTLNQTNEQKSDVK